MTRETALRLAESLGNIEQFARGANAHGKFAEVIAMCVRDRLTDPASPWVVINSPTVPANYVRTWLNPDPTSARDLLYEVEVSEARHLLVPGAQVKIGSAKYIARSLLRHTSDGRYGRICDVDARLVLPDGSPRVAPDAFTRGQAAALEYAGFKFVGIEHLEEDAKRMHAGYKEAVRYRAAQLEQDLVIQAKYAPRRVASRAGVSVGISVILVIGTEWYWQYSHYRRAAQEAGNHDGSAKRHYAKRAAQKVAEQTAIAGGTALGSVVAEATTFHIASRFTSSSRAQTIASAVVAAGFAVAEVAEEVIAYRRGTITLGEALMFGSAKVIIAATPVILQAVAGSAGAAVGSALSVAMRWGIQFVRNAPQRQVEAAAPAAA
jgi:hypothetical protein